MSFYPRYSAFLPKTIFLLLPGENNECCLCSFPPNINKQTNKKKAKHQLVASMCVLIFAGWLCVSSTLPLLTVVHTDSKYWNAQGVCGKQGSVSLWWWGHILSSLYTVCPMTVVYNTSGHWLYPIYFYTVLSLVNNGLVLPFPPFSNWKRKGTDKPELNLFWQLLQSSNCEGGPAHWCGMICSHLESRQKEPLLFSKCIQPCIDILAEMPAHSHLNGKKTRILGGGGDGTENEGLSSDNRK